MKLHFFILKKGYYFNRKIPKLHLTINDYVSDTDKVQYIEYPEKVNVDFGNDIEITQILNWFTTSENVRTEIGFKPNYVIICDDNDNINSRWFVTEFDKQRGLQYRATLKRDVINDYKSEIVNSSCYVKRGYPNLIEEELNPLVFNPEGFNTNQIKKSEILLKDKSLSPWIMIYIAKNFYKKSIGYDDGSPADIVLNVPIEESRYANGTRKVLVTNSDNEFPLSVYFRAGGNYYRTNFSGSDSQLIPVGNTNSSLVVDNASDLLNLKTYYNTIKAAILRDNSSLQEDFDSQVENAYTNQLTIKDSKGRIFKVTGYTKGTNTQIEHIGSVSYAEGYQAFTSAISSVTTITTQPNEDSYIFTYLEETVSLTQIASPSFEIDMSTKKLTDDNIGFNILAVPLDIVVTDSSLGFEFSTNRNFQMQLVSNITKELTSSFVYDVQYLPYCPLQNVFEETEVGGQKKGLADLFHFNENQYLKVDQGIIFFLGRSDFTFSIEKDIYGDITSLTTKQIKTINETEFYRLTSPNYNGAFEFSPLKNHGVEEFVVTCSLKPYSPYIHVAPLFKGLYSKYNFFDARGLICGGDFSLPIVNDAWKQYEIQNKNYQVMFDREIKTMDKYQGWQKAEAVFGALTGTVGGVTSGAMAGSVVGPAGAIAGGVIGGITSAAGGIADVVKTYDLLADQKGFKVDMYKYNLGNIKALPYSLTKVSPLNENNKTWPFIEVYGCTDVEKTIVEETINKTGMTIESMTEKLYNYIEGYTDVASLDGTKYIQGEIVIFYTGGLLPENQIINAINYELSKGVYL